MNINIFIYLFISFLLMYIFSKLSYKLNLVDIPNKRKIHNNPTVYTGGVAISFIFCFSIIWIDFSINTLNQILSIAFLMSLIGFIDDKLRLNVGGKLSLQILPIFYLIFSQNLYLTSLGDYDYFSIGLGAFEIPFSLLAVLFLINSFNYFDGLDGTLCFTFISVLLILYFLIPDRNIQYYLVFLSIPIFIFTLFNFSLLNLPKMFLGDSGSLFLGFVISFLLIYLAKQNLVHPILLAWSIAIYVFEFLSINIIRLKFKKNIFQAGLDHLHHLLHKKLKTIFLTNLVIILIQLILFIIGYLSFFYINKITSLILFVIIFFIYLFLRSKFKVTN
jgi:UDP-GlcNAc:undecaprenyl-phosphate GlcNAc-1-phosphate transferase